MTRNNLIRPGLAAVLAAVTWLAFAQNTLEIIPLRHRTPEQVLPVLRPLLEPGATLSGHANQLFMRASRSNVAEIRRVLESIDRPQRRLQISVRFDDGSDSARAAIEARGSIGNRGAGVEVRAQDSRSFAGERIDQRLQVLEGGRGTIQVGQTIPLRQRQIVQTPAGPVVRETVTLQDRATGFSVVPRLSGDTVHLEISPQRENADSFARVATTVSARLGEWFEVGGVEQNASRNDRGIVAASRSASSTTRRTWLKVEEIRN